MTDDLNRLIAEVTLIRVVLGLNPVHSLQHAVEKLLRDGREAFEKERGDACEYAYQWADRFPDRTLRSVDTKGEMVERAKKFLLRPFDSHEEDAEALAAEFTALRTQTLEEAARVADNYADGVSNGLPSTARTIASAIRALR